MAILSGCAKESGARLGMFSATAPVLAILDNDLLQGTGRRLEKTGTIDIQQVLKLQRRHQSRPRPLSDYLAPREQSLKRHAAHPPPHAGRRSNRLRGWSKSCRY
jgi:hypothetical protein